MIAIYFVQQDSLWFGGQAMDNIIVMGRRNHNRMIIFVRRTILIGNQGLRIFVGNQLFMVLEYSNLPSTHRRRFLGEPFDN